MLELLTQAIFTGVPTNAAYDLLKAGWRRWQKSPLEALYLKSFEHALEDMKPSLARYSSDDGDIALNIEQLKSLLGQASSDPMPIRYTQVTAPDALGQLARLLSERQIVMIGGHNLTDSEYELLVRRVVHHAQTRFREDVAADHDAFQRAMLEAAEDIYGNTKEGRTAVEELSRYMREAHDLILDRLASVEVAILNEIRATRAVADGSVFYPPSYTRPLPEGYVKRPTLMRRIKGQLLSDDESRTATLTTTLEGGGGFGKTTIAQALCHDPHVIAHYPDGILWITVGEKPDLVGLLQSQAEVLTKVRPGLTDADQLVERLNDIIGERRLLIVLDDVWGEESLRKLLRMGVHCDKLVTTRRFDLAKRHSTHDPVEVNELEPDDAADILIGLLPHPEAVTDRAPFLQLGSTLGLWAQMIALAGSWLRDEVEFEGKTPLQAVQAFEHELAERGFTAFDRTDEKQRERAISISLEVSLERLKEHRVRALELAIFPRALDIPFDTLAQLWRATSADKAFPVDHVRREIRRFALFREYDAERRTVRLHDVVLAALGEILRKERDPVVIHAALIDAYGDLAALPDTYAWRNIAYHLREAGKLDTLPALLLDYRFLGAKLDATDPNALIADCDTLPGDEAIRLLKSALSMSAHVLDEDKSALAHQLVGRLMLWRRDLPAIHTLTEAIMEHVPGLYPLHPDSDYVVLNPAGGALVRTLAGHTNRVNHIALTPDGRRAVSASEDGRLIVWDLETGAARHTLAGHTSHVTHVALTPDGRRAVSASWDKSLIVWDLETGITLHTLTGHREAVNRVAITPDGRRAVSASEDGRLIVWDLETGKARQTLAGHTSAVWHVAVTPDGRRAVSASSDKTLIVWDLETGAARQSLIGHTNRVNHVALTPDGRRAVSASEDGRLIVWDLETGAARHTLAGHTDGVTHVALTPDGRRAVSASADKKLIVWDLETGGARQSLAGHTSHVNRVALTPDGRRAISASSDKTLIVWDLETGAARQTPAGHTKEVYHVAVTPDGRRAISSSEDKSLIVWDLETGGTRQTLAGHTWSVRHVAITPDGRRAVSASLDKTLIVWDLETGAARQTLAGHTGWVNHIAVTPDGLTAVSASNDRRLIVWDLETGTARQTLAGHRGRVTHVALTPDGRSAVSASEDGRLIVWDLETGAARQALAGHTDRVNHVAITRDGRSAVSASSDKTLIVWDLETGAAVMRVDATPEGRGAIARAYPGALAFPGFMRTDDGWQLIHVDDILLVQHPGGAAARWTGDANIWSAELLAGDVIVAGDPAGRVLFLRWRGGENQPDEGDQ